MMHTCLFASGETWITWDHVCLPRVWMHRVESLACFSRLAILLGISTQPLPWRSDKNYSSSGVHVNQSGAGWGYNEIMKCASAFFFFQERPLGATIFRHNKEIARGVQSLRLSYGVLSTCQCTVARLRAWMHTGKKWRPASPSRQCQLKPLWDSVDGCFRAWLFLSVLTDDGRREWDQESWFWVMYCAHTSATCMVTL